MNNIFKLFVPILFVVFMVPVHGQEQLFSLDDCISYALENNTMIGRAENDVLSQYSQLEQRKAERGPNLILSANESVSSNNTYDSSTAGWNRETNNNMNVSLSSNIVLYNGAKIRNAILQGKMNVSAAETEVKTEKELLSLDILANYITVLQAKEQMKNTQSQLESTAKELEEATIRREAGVMSPADYLNIKSQHSADKAALVSSQSTLRIALVTLMQTMNMPVSSSFDIMVPNEQSFVKMSMETDPAVVYNVALGIQPGIKTAELDLESAEMDIQLAKVDALPYLSLNGGVQSNYYSGSDLGFNEQLSNQLTPTIGLSLSIPIYQRKEVKNKVKQAFISRDNYRFNLVDTKNDLRKSIEQACTDAQTANSAYLSYKEQYLAEQESFKLAEEMFSQGMLSSVDYLTSKNNLIEAENNLTKAKYEMVLQKEIIEYYMGKAIAF
ncbi:TolC family protein [Saccharicrinis fermentans]|uniref:Outer membrane efflux protein BepC n=1 Tax=Saccharicrinis fermentans DSM 9555 = JCM 21142 TaxID=869213 RepID=W7YMN3_9BACT|nr:TolC family protein [Saccharicrinis fermentans]GAF03654.1 outer membrane efflux protein BepC precursor [Saccharicrinis fermentans DSM 9555 = JCM 21142]